jgi:hypothetical protein
MTMHHTITAAIGDNHATRLPPASSPAASRQPNAGPSPLATRWATPVQAGHLVRSDQRYRSDHPSAAAAALGTSPITHRYIGSSHLHRSTDRDKLRRPAQLSTVQA